VEIQNESVNPFSKKRKYEEVSNTPGKAADLNKSSTTSYYEAQSVGAPADVSYEDYHTAKDDSPMEIDITSAPQVPP
jgi:hypothetical protein